MILIVGLGNPGKKFEKTRHNLGLRAVESLKRKVKGFSDWKKIKKIQSEISQGEISGQKVILVNPKTFMNLSGRSIKILITLISLKTTMAELGKHLWIVHDDIDLPLGKIRIVKNRGSAGHKGVESIIKELGSKNFVRFRIGICPIRGKPENPERFVLEKFNKAEEKIVKEIIKKTAEAVEFSITGGIEKAMTEFN